MSLTGLARHLFAPRWRELERHNTEAETLQRQVLSRLVSRARDTEYGRYHHFADLNTYEDFTSNVPINSYEELKGDIDRMRHGEKDVLWPGRVKWYAKSSGTTNDKSKFIPVSKEGLKRLHYKGGTDVVALYLRNNPQSRMFDGRGLILGGSHAPNYNLPGSLVGDLSAIPAQRLRDKARPHCPRGNDEECHQPLGSSLLDALSTQPRHGAFRKDTLGRGVAKPGGLFPRRRGLHSLPPAV